MQSSRRTFWRPAPLDRIDLIAGAALLVGTFALLLATMEIGYTRDEGMYFKAAYDYIGWFEQLWAHLHDGDLAKSFTKDNVDKHWGYNAEHPALVKTLFALSYKLFADKLDWLSQGTAMRLPGAAFGSLAVLFTYLMGRQAFGRLAGLIAAGALLFQPRYFFHAHLACFDVPVTAVWLMVMYAYWRSYESKGWAIATGLLWGVSLSVKLNGFFLPVVMGLHWLALHWRDFGFSRDKEGPKLGLPPVPWAFVSMAVFGPLLFYALWPRHWFETIDRIQWYMNFHLDHVHYFVEYFGQWYKQPPFPIEFPWVMTAVTVPATLLLAFGIGLFAAAKKWRLADWLGRWREALRERRLPDTRAERAGFDPRGTGFLLLLNFAFPIALIGMPETPIFGGTKHWMPAMPFLAIFAGAGVAFALEPVRRRIAGRFDAVRARLLGAGAALLLAASTIGPAVYATWHNHPFGLSYYNELIGSHRGAADAGMMRQYWGYSTRQALPWLDDNAPDNAGVWLNDTIGYAWDMYQRDGLVRDDLRAVGRGHSDYALYDHDRAFRWELTRLWRDYETFAPTHVVSLDGVLMVGVYERPD